MHVETHFLFTSTLPFLVRLNWLHLEQDVLRHIEDHDIAPAISHFFNGFFGSIQAVGLKVAANNMQSRTHKKVCVTWINSFRISYGFFLAFIAFQLWGFCELTLEAICSLSLWSIIVIVQQSKQLSCIFFFRRKFKFFLKILNDV